MKENVSGCFFLNTVYIDPFIVNCSLKVAAAYKINKCGIVTTEESITVVHSKDKITMYN